MSWLKRSLVSPVGGACLSAFVSALECMGRGANLLRVLTYHRVDEIDDDTPYNPSLISATPNEFARQMDLIADRGLAVSMDEVLDAWQRRRSLKPGAVLLTFDDANCCFARNAWPILQDRGLPVTVFVPTAFPSSSCRFWWDRVHAAVFNTTIMRVEHNVTFDLSTPTKKRLAVREISRRVKSMPHHDGCQWVDEICESLGEVEFANNVLTWDELSDLASAGVVLAPHTRTHPLLSRVPIEQARAEAVGSFHDLRERIGRAPKVLAYPAGDFNASVASMLDEEGFAAAFTVKRGINAMHSEDRFRLRRINVGRGTTLPLLRAQLLPQVKHL
jgi:peptidoglycan/xylan/chitin deacetylase (PgdA/CDA1 family)